VANVDPGREDGYVAGWARQNRERAVRKARRDERPEETRAADKER
jgi:hypothetical protein